MDLSAHISELLYKHDCVIVPGFGAFIRQDRAAAIHPVTHEIHPPGKTVKFNKLLREDDGLLIDQVRRSEALTYEAASASIRNTIAAWESQLNSQQKISFTGLGSLTLDPEGNRSFEAKEESNFSSETRYLPTIKAYPVIPEKTTRKERRKEREEQKEQIDSDRKAGFRLQPLPALVMILLLTAITWTMIQPENSSLTHLGIGNWIKALTPTETVNPELTTAIEIEMPEEEITLKEEIPVEIDVAITDVSSTSAPEGYLAIIGSFGKQRNADKIKDKLSAQGYDVYVMPAGNGFYRVGIYFSAELQDSYQSFQQLDSGSFPNAWFVRNLQ